VKTFGVILLTDKWMGGHWRKRNNGGGSVRE